MRIQSLSRTDNQLAEFPVNIQERFKALQKFTELVIATPVASENAKENALRTLETFKYIMLNSELITKKFRGDLDVYKNEKDKANQVIRDHNHTAFHLNSYDNVDSAITSLHRAADQLIGAYSTASRLNALEGFVEKFFYDQEIGCLEARIAASIDFIANFESVGFTNINQIIEKALKNSLNDSDFYAQLSEIKKSSFQYIDTPVSINGKGYNLSWEKLKEVLCNIIFQLDNDSTDYFLLTQAFSPLENYFEYLRHSTVRVELNHEGMICHAFDNKLQAEKFRSYLKQLSCLKGEAALQKAKLTHEKTHGPFVFKLSSEQLQIIAFASGLSSIDPNHCFDSEVYFSTDQFFSSPAERVACGALQSPYFGKSVSGFGNSSAWKQVISAVTLSERKNKPAFRDPALKKLKPFRVRGNRFGDGYEIHDARLPKQGLFLNEKEERSKQGQIPVPPHQSFTYYEPQNKTYNVSYFSPGKLSIAQRNEMIGLRVSSNTGLINRIVNQDTGTFKVPYGFETEKEAAYFLRRITEGKKWALNLSELKERHLPGKYNEVMVRANWRCDGSSQIVIYPPRGNLSGRYAAILRKLDLERHLKNSHEIYCKSPVEWYEDYEVPISFWDKFSPTLYTKEQQKKDLEAATTTYREQYLKALVFFFKTGVIPADLKESLYSLFEKLLNGRTSAVEVKDIREIFMINLGYVVLDQSRFFDEIFREKSVAGLNSSSLEVLVSYGCKETIFQSLLKLGDVYKKRILSFFTIPNDYNNLITFTDAAYKQALDIVLSAAIELKNKDSRDMTARNMLLAEKSVNYSNTIFQLAADKGDNDTINMLLEYAFQIKEIDSEDMTLVDMLLASDSNNIPAAPLRIAARNGHSETVNILMKAAFRLDNTGYTTAKKMLLAADSTKTPAHALRLAADQGHTDTINKLMEWAFQLKIIDAGDSTAKELLKAGPDELPAQALQLAIKNGYANTVNALLEWDFKIQKIEKANKTVNQKLLLGSLENPAQALQIAAQNNDSRTISTMMKWACMLQEIDKKDTTAKDILLAAEYPGNGHAYLLRSAAYFGLTDVVNTLLQAAFDLKEIDHGTVKRMLLAGFTKGGDAYAFRIAAQNGYHLTVNAFLECAYKLKEANKDDTTAKKMILSRIDVNSPEIFRIVLKASHLKMSEIFLDQIIKLKDLELYKKILSKSHPSIVFTEIQKEKIINGVINIILERKKIELADIAVLYSSNRFGPHFFSSMKKVESVGEALKIMHERAMKDLTGASMKTLLALAEESQLEANLRPCR